MKCGEDRIGTEWVSLEAQLYTSLEAQFLSSESVGSQPHTAIPKPQEQTREGEPTLHPTLTLRINQW